MELIWLTRIHLASHLAERQALRALAQGDPEQAVQSARQAMRLKNSATARVLMGFAAGQRPG